MKSLTKFLLVICFITVFACRDTKKEEEAAAKAQAEIEAVIEEVESVEAEVEAITEEVEQDAKDLEDALNDLDNI